MQLQGSFALFIHRLIDQSCCPFACPLSLGRAVSGGLKFLQSFFRVAVDGNDKLPTFLSPLPTTPTPPLTQLENNHSLAKKEAEKRNEKRTGGKQNKILIMPGTANSRLGAQRGVNPGRASAVAAANLLTM